LEGLTRWQFNEDFKELFDIFFYGIFLRIVESSEADFFEEMYDLS